MEEEETGKVEDVVVSLPPRTVCVRTDFFPLKKSYRRNRICYSSALASPPPAQKDNWFPRK